MLSCIIKIKRIIREKRLRGSLVVLKNTLLDLLLLPRSFYKKLSDKANTLHPGIILVGFIDIGFALGAELFGYFFGKTRAALIFNISLTVCFVLLVGLIDVVFFALPLFDIFKFFRVKEKIKNLNGQLIKLMKVYVASHFPVMPVNAFFYWLVLGPYGTEALSLLGYFVTSVITPLWHAAILARGINAIYEFDERLKTLVFFIAYLWTTMLGYALGFMINNWFFVLYR
ncbi:MAG TPA: hypothetical protein DEF39_14375 [Hungateiclostridium thermocellum]|uniref:SNARE associated Golgi protein n=1 Tax=Acetivibrio thermocellus AD2 TaxID=1138384 RepID=A0AB36TDA4_ACETH|nr:hypothetical protein Clo1313_0273 [Acetivibrio thermocellus DSM 1313]ALX07286.1 hypothetical protein AD2_00277 [Acetivibrio thermocellus AD2]ANV75024.1 hypothetical protein LQRI_0276 [Acetivibrio thermocellus DSM 2360]EIC04247.1 hypothetical protein YSBL_2122 [Acetivibrio thermocellus YS]CDG37147.1 hypothetical protein CTHBC1_2562 [Acetivibrio thermocellus BC1]SOD21359.1 hypothetical protein SAMN04515622_0150 [Acetivibrio thermocellus]